MSTVTIIQNGNLNGFLPKEMTKTIKDEMKKSEDRNGDFIEEGHGFILEMAHGFIKSEILRTAVSLGVFEALHGSEGSPTPGPLTPVSLQVLAEKTGVPVPNVERFLNALAALQLVVRESGDSGPCYTGTQLSQRYLTRRSKFSLVPIIEMTQMMTVHMNNLEQCLKNPGWFEAMKAEGPKMGPGPSGPMGPPGGAPQGGPPGPPGGFSPPPSGGVANGFSPPPSGGVANGFSPPPSGGMANGFSPPPSGGMANGFSPPPSGGVANGLGPMKNVSKAGPPMSVAGRKIPNSKHLTCESSQRVGPALQNGTGQEPAEDSSKSPSKAPQNGLTKAGPPAQSGLTKAGPPAQNGLTKAGPPAQSGLTKAGPPAQSGLTKAGPPAQNGLTKAGPPAQSGLTKAGPPAQNGLTKAGPPAQNGKTGPPKNCFEAMEGQLKMLQGFQSAMHSQAVNATGLLNGWDLSNFSTAVDLGGGLGTFGKHLAAENPHINTTIVDIPPVIQLAKMAASEEEKKLSNLNFSVGDFFQGGLPKADIYILGHILHDWTDKECETILKNVTKALNPGGVVVVLEKLVSPTEDGPLCPALMDLIMLMSTPGKERTLAQYRTLLTGSGLHVIAKKTTDCYSWYDVIIASTRPTTSL